jgi:D-alanyl-D-alanine endopeptidase (penicillin-binding protein 7)
LKSSITRVVEGNSVQKNSVHLAAFVSAGLAVVLSLATLAVPQTAQASQGSVSAQQPGTPAKSSQPKSAQTKPAQGKPAQAGSAQSNRAQSASRSSPPRNAQAKTSQKRPSSAGRQANAAGSRKASVRAEPGYNSMGTRLGLRSQLSEISLNSSAVMVVDQKTGEILLEKNPDAALPIASITKVMTAMVIIDAGLPLSEVITITADDTNLEKYSSSRLRVGARFSRAELLHLALMSSENRAAHALGRTFPGGMDVFVNAMNEKAQALGMGTSRFVEPTGLSSANVASPRDLSRLVKAAHEFPLIREYSTAREAVVRVGGREQQFRNTNALTRNDNWDLGLSKTGFIRDAGKCLVMQASIDDQDVIIVMLDAEGSAKRISDAERIRRWLSGDRDREPTPVRS